MRHTNCRVLLAEFPEKWWNEAMNPLTIWPTRYMPPADEIWQGRREGPKALRYHEIVQCNDLTTPFSIDKPAYGILGFVCDEGIKRNQGRPGAAEGPAALRKALGKLPVHTHDAFLYDFGNITCVDGNLEESQRALGEAVAILSNLGICPIVIGGGHELAWGHFLGIASAYPGQGCAIVNFDAHFDLRPLLEGKKGSSGTSFNQIAQFLQAQNLRFDYTCLGIQSLGNTEILFNKAKELKASIVYAEDFHEGGTEKSLSLIEEVIARSEKIYVSICLDVFAAPFAPGVSAPQALGLLPWHAIPGIKLLSDSGKVIGWDVAELSPPFDRDGTTAQLAASLISLMIK